MLTTINPRRPTIAALLCPASTLIVGLYAALFQSGFVSYIGAEFGRATWLSVIVYAIYGLGALIAVSAVFSGSVPRKEVFAIWVFAAFAAAPLLLSHGSIGPVTKSYVVGLASVTVLCVVARCADLRRVAQFAASVVCVVSVFCLLDVCFFDGFSNAVGRAAFLYINPNVAAFAILLGAAASTWSVPVRWLPAFLVLVAGALFATLSRSAMLIGALTLLACVPSLLPDYRAKLQAMCAGIRSATAVGTCVVMLLAGALHNNPAFPVALDGGFHGAVTALKWLEVGYERIRGSSGSTSEGEQEALTEAIKLVEANNSASARALLAERAWLQFRNGPATGIGLERAFALAPHNSYLLFAVAFGYVGWLIIPALVGLLLYLGGWRRGGAVAILVAAAALFSHDLLFALPLVSAFVLIFPSISQWNTEGAKRTVSPALLAGLAAAIALACALAYAHERHRHPSYKLDVSGNTIKHLAGAAYYVPLPAVAPPGVLRLDAEGKDGSGGGGLSMSEDGTPLVIESNDMKSIGLMGPGRYGFHKMWAIFSSSDGTRPNSNERTYHVSADVVIHPLFTLAVLASIVWAALWVAVAYNFRRNQDEERQSPFAATQTSRSE